MSKVLAIDPGTTNLGWAYTEHGDVVEADVDTVWVRQSPIHMTLIPAVVQWFRQHRYLWHKADLVLIELQFLNKGSVGLFPPMIVMETLLSVSELEYPGKIKTISSSALKQHFQIRGTYEERKKEVVRLAGLSHLKGRVHDVADCLLMIDYNKSKEQRLLELAKLADDKAARRANVRANLQIREESPERKIRTCIKCCNSAHKTYVRRGTGFICGNCYGKEWRKEQKQSNTLTK